MEAALQSLRIGLPILLLHLGVAALVLGVGIVVYTLLTPHKELQLIRDGNQAAGISLGGALVGLAIPVSVTLATGVSVADIAIWGAGTLILQLLLFTLTDLVLRNLSKRIVDGEIATASLLAAIKIAGSLLLGASLVG
jgi:putative membrane protein